MTISKSKNKFALIFSSLDWGAITQNCDFFSRKVPVFLFSAMRKSCFNLNPPNFFKSVL